MPAITLPIRAYRVYPLAGQEYDDHNFGHVYENLLEIGNVPSTTSVEFMHALGVTAA